MFESCRAHQILQYQEFAVVHFIGFLPSWPIVT